MNSNHDEQKNRANRINRDRNQVWNQACENDAQIIANKRGMTVAVARAKIVSVYMNAR